MTNRLRQQEESARSNPASVQLCTHHRNAVSEMPNVSEIGGEQGINTLKTQWRGLFRGRTVALKRPLL